MTKTNVRSLGLVIAATMLVVACGGPGSGTARPGSQAPGSGATTSRAPSTGGTATQAPSTGGTQTQAPSTGGTQTQPPSTGGAGQYTIGYSNAFGIGNGFREEQLCTAKAQALVSGQVSEGTWLNANEADYPQLQQIRDLIAKQPDAIVFNPNGPEVLNPAIDEAQAAGIVTVALDAYVTDPETYNLSNSQEEYGYIGAKWLFERIGDAGGEVYYMRGLAGHPADNDRHRGVLRALGEHTNITLLPSEDGVATGWDPAEGTRLINDFITSGGYDDIEGIWTSGIDQQIVDAIAAANKDFVPIVGADLKGFVDMLLNTSGNYEGLEGIAVYNPAAVGGAGVDLALRVLNGEEIETTTQTVPDAAGNDIEIEAVFLPTPEAYDNTTEQGRARLQEIAIPDLNNLWPVSWQIEGLTDYTFEQMLACKGPGE
jgi:ribose transport system substrate-binding protein